MPKRYPRYSIEFYADKEGRKPVLVWIEKKLTPAQRQAITIAMDEVLAHEGINVVGSEFGKTTSKTAITEFRVRQDAHELASRLEARAAARATSEGDAETRSGRGGGGSDQQSAEASPPARRKRGERVFLRVFFHA